VPLWKQSHLWFHQNKLSLFCPFLFLWKLHNTTFPDLLLVTKARRYERISFSLLKDRTQLLQYIFPSSELFAKELSGGLQVAVILSCTVRLETGILQCRISSYNCLLFTSELYTAPKLSHVDSVFHSLDLFPRPWTGKTKPHLDRNY